MWTRREFAGMGTAAAFAGAGCTRRKVVQSAAYVFVANAEGKTIAVADLATFAVARQIRLEHEPTQVIAPPAAPSVYALTPASGTIHEIAIEQLKVQRKLRLGQTAVTMRLAPDSSSLFVLLAQPRKLVRVPLDRFAVDWDVSLPLTPTDLDLGNFFDPAIKGNRFTGAVSFGATGRFAFFEPGGKMRAPIELGGEAGAVRFQYGKELIVANLSDRMLSVYDTIRGKRIVELPLKNRPDQLCFSPDSGQLFVTGVGADVVSVVYPYRTPEVAETVLAGRTPGAMAVSNGYLFIANPTSGDVSILSLGDRRIMGVVSVGSEPCFITTTPNGTFALVLNKKSGDMAVLRIDKITRNRQKSASLFTMIPVGSGPVSAAVRMI
jgi:DNA-binding beta-propeller fold protein YncE